MRKLRHRKFMQFIQRQKADNWWRWDLCLDSLIPKQYPYVPPYSATVLMQTIIIINIFR